MQLMLLSFTNKITIKKPIRLSGDFSLILGLIKHS